MTTVRVRKKKENTDEKKIKQRLPSFSEKMGRVTIITTLVGYAALISYTWPLGFIPIISIESLPILLIGFFFAALAFLIVVFLLWIPLFILLNQDVFYSTIFEDDSKATEPNKTLNIPLRDIFSGCKKPLDYIMVIWGMVGVFIFIGLSIGIWYLFTKENPGTEILIFATWSFFAYMAFGSLVNAKTNMEYGFATAGLAFVFLLLPIMYSGVVDKKRGNEVTNTMVKQALEATKLGGDIPVKILVSQKHEVIFGHLIFFDGSKAWLKVCNMEKERTITETKVDSLSHLSETFSCNSANSQESEKKVE